MSQKFYFTIISLIIAAGLGLSATDAVGAGHEVVMQFEVNRDVGILGWESANGNGLDDIEQLSSAGTVPSNGLPPDDSQTFGTVRGVKSNEHAMIMDFDTAAMGTFLQDNPGTATWTFNVRSGPENGTQQQFHEVKILLQTVESTNDWAEGDGLSNFLNYNWTSGTAAATYYYAQTVYNMVGGVPVLDTENSKQWIDPDSGSYTFTARDAAYDDAGVPDDVGIGDPPENGFFGFAANATPEFTNSVNLTPDIVLADEYTSVSLDDDIVNALINDENNRGLKFNLDQDIPDEKFSNQNWVVFTRECDSATVGQCAAFLEVTITPDAIPGDFDLDGDVDGADYNLWQRGGSPNGVGAADLAVWEANFGKPNSTPATTSVPEPSSLLLLLACSSAILCGRCGKRQAA